MDGTVVVCVVVGVIIAYLFLQRGRKESYSLDHAILNTPSPTTLWINMGYWRVCPVLFPDSSLGHEFVPGSMYRAVPTPRHESRNRPRFRYSRYWQWLRRFDISALATEAKIVERSYLRAGTSGNCSAKISGDHVCSCRCGRIRRVFER